MEAIRPRWSSSSFLLYAGALVVLLAMVVLLGWLSDDYGEGAFFGWSALVWVATAAVAAALKLSPDRVAAGLFGLVSLVAFIVFAGSFLDLIGLLDFDEGPIAGFDVGRLLLYLVSLVAAIGAVARFRFPLIGLVATAAGWLFIVDLVSGGGDWSAVVAIFIGLFLMLIGIGAETAYGFWIHFVAGLSIAGGFLALWHSSDWEWILIAVVAMFLLTIARGLQRANYAVLAAILLFLAWSHFVEDWLDGSSGIGSDLLPVDGGTGISPGGDGEDIWQRALLYGVYGVALVAIGIWFDRRRRTSEHLEEPATV